jgi:lactate permease
MAAIIAGLVMGISVPKLVTTYGETLKRVRYSLLTIAAMLALGFYDEGRGARLDARPRVRARRLVLSVLRCDAGLAGRRAHRLRHLVERALRRIAEGLARAARLSPVLMAAANSSGGVMGKMIDAQSIVVASTGDAVVRPRRRHPALRVLPQPGTRALMGCW